MTKIQTSTLSLHVKKIKIGFESHIKLTNPSKPQLLVAIEKKLECKIFEQTF
jgi:hypothetical protein